jgi:hypothetical protein
VCDHTFPHENVFEHPIVIEQVSTLLSLVGGNPSAKEVAINDLCQVYFGILFGGDTVPNEFMETTKTYAAIAWVVKGIIIADVEKVIAIIEEGNLRQLRAALGAHVVVQVVYINRMSV